MAFLVIALALLSMAVAAALSSSLLAHPPSGLVRTNFQDSEVAVVGGVVILAGFLAGEVGLTIAYLLHPKGGAGPTFISRDHWGLLVVALGFFGLGLLDDVAGSARSRGFRGHARALATGEITTGALKALGGAAIGLMVGALWEGRFGPALLDAAVLALAANFVNLLDLRPGRASKGFLLVWVVLAYVAWGSAYVVLSLPVAAATLLWLAPDLSERGMLGDMGANLLGAVLGAGAILSLGIPGRLVVLGALLVLTAAAERWSFSKAIDATPPLRWLDQLGRVHQ